MPCLRQQAFQLARRSLWPARTFASHPHQWSKRRRGRAPSKNITPQGAHSGAATPAHTAAQRGRSGRRTRGRHDRRATARSAGRGGRDDRRQHSEGSDRGERPACEARAAGDDRRGPATAHRTTPARAEARRVLPARHERKQTPCRSGRLLTDGVAVRSAPAVRPPTIANPPIFDIGSPTPFPGSNHPRTSESERQRSGDGCPQGHPKGKA
jgi:hypothetical protein